MTHLILLFGAGSAFAVVLTPAVGRVARALGLFDCPGPRRAHPNPVPTLGGVAIFLAFHASCILAFSSGAVAGMTPAAGPWGAALLGGGVVVLGLGIADDLCELGWSSKFLAQLCVGALVVWLGYKVEVITNPFSHESHALGWLAGPVTVLWVVGMTNAFNLIDGVDGLAAGVALIASLAVAGVAVLGGGSDVVVLAMALGGALAGFLPYNFHPARVFLGDTGSLFLGYVLSLLSIRGAQKGPAAVAILVPVLALGLPILDTLLALVRRWEAAERESSLARLFRADRRHIHHRLLDAGLSQRRVVLLLYAVSAGLGGAACLSVTLNGLGAGLLLAAIVLASYLGVRRLGYEELRFRPHLQGIVRLPMVGPRLFQPFVDLGLIGGAFLTARAFAPTLPGAAAALPGLLVVKLTVLALCGAYRGAYPVRSIARATSLAAAAVAASMCAWGVSGAFGRTGDPRGILADVGFTTFALLGIRLLVPILEALRVPWQESGAVAIGGAREEIAETRRAVRAVGRLPDQLPVSAGARTRGRRYA